MNNNAALTPGLAQMCLRTAVLWPAHGKRFQKKGEATERREARRGGSQSTDAGLHRSEQAAFLGPCL